MGDQLPYISGNVLTSTALTQLLTVSLVGTNSLSMASSAGTATILGRSEAALNSNSRLTTLGSSADVTIKTGIPANAATASGNVLVTNRRATVHPSNFVCACHV
jgi:hypothetical protein